MVWGRGRAAGQPGTIREGPSQCKTRLACSEIQRALIMEPSATIPSWRTTPTAVVYRDAGLPTAQAALDQALYRFAYRLRMVDRQHPLARWTELERIARGRGVGGYQRSKTKVQWVARMLSSVQRPKLVPPRYPPGSRSEPTDGLTKEAAATY